jgi:hypothetical protein
MTRRAALAIQRSLDELNRKHVSSNKLALAVRIAIDLGLVMLDTLGEIFGNVPNVAAQALAEPGGSLRGRGAQRRSGAGDAVSESSAPAAGDAELGSAISRRLSVARRDRPMRRWERARLGDGQLVLIVGAPNRGISLAVARDTAYLGGMELFAAIAEYATAPIAEWGRQRFGSGDVPPEQRLADLESSLAQVKLDPAENSALLAPR